MHHTRIKICGITRDEDLQCAVEAGADALGFVFHEASPRNVSIATARALSGRVPAFVARVALFMDAGEELIRSVLDEVELDLLQFHGQESPQSCARWGMEYIKAIPMGGVAPDGRVLASYVDDHGAAKGFLLDSNAVGEAGGSGKTFDWTRIGELFGANHQIILAGGLNPDNVSEAVRGVRPYAVDVSSGVEAAKGIKDPLKVMRFTDAVRRADLELNTQPTSNQPRSKGAAA
ncbi:MAG: phosphoribosylanthranilate isomerase [Gammaproteobacteria bacterium]